MEILKRSEHEHLPRAEHDAERELHTSQCPSCGGTMQGVRYESLDLLRCKGCCGVFLNAVAARQVLHEKEPGYWSHMIRSLVASWESDT